MKETTILDQAKMVELQAEKAWTSGDEELGMLLDKQLSLLESINELRLNAAKTKIENGNFSQNIMDSAEDNAGSTMKENYNPGINFFYSCEYWEFVYNTAELLVSCSDYQ